MKRNVGALLLILALSGYAFGWTHGSGDTLLVVAGQSNAGDGNTLSFGDLPTNLRTPDSNIKVWNGTSFQTQANGVSDNPLSPAAPANIDNWGPDAEYSRLWRITNPSKTLYIVKFAATGTNLGGSAPTWNSAVSSSLFDQMTGYVNAAKAALSNPRVPDVLWMQGESDAGDVTFAGNYAANIAAFKTKVRTAWGNAATQIIIGRISTFAFTFGSTVRTAQDGAADSKTSVINTDSFSRAGAGIHYDGTGQVSLGAAMYAVAIP